MMANMPNSVRDWNTDAFNQTFKTELESFRKDVLPLALVIGKGNSIYDGDLGAVVNSVKSDENFIYARIGIYFAELIACCSCGEGAPIEEAYCEMDVSLDKATAEVTFTVVADYLNK